MQITRTQAAIALAVLVAFIVGIIVSWPKRPPDTSEIVNNAVAKVEEQYKKQIADKDILIKTKESMLRHIKYNYRFLLQTVQMKAGNYTRSSSLPDII